MALKSVNKQGNYYQNKVSNPNINFSSFESHSWNYVKETLWLWLIIWHLCTPFAVVNVLVLPLFASTPFMIMFILFSAHCTMQWCFDRICNNGFFSYFGHWSEESFGYNKWKQCLLFSIELFLVFFPKLKCWSHCVINLCADFANWSLCL